MRPPRFSSHIPGLTLSLSLALSSTGAEPDGTGKLPRLKISENQRFLATEDDRPFFYLADTAWDLFHRVNREDADFYLAARARQGFTVIQAVALDVEGITRTIATDIGTHEEKGAKQFTPPPGPNPYNDWVLVLDDAARNFPPPGQR